jgi:hypothetical protein
MGVRNIDPGYVARRSAPLDRLFDTLAGIARFAGYQGDADDQVRLTFGLIASAVLLDPWLWRTAQPSRDEIVDALTAYMLPMFLRRAAPKPGRRSGRTAP